MNCDSHAPTDFVGAIVYAAPAPGEEVDHLPEQTSRDRDLDSMCERWVSWCRTRRLYGPAPISGTVLGKLSGGSTRPMVPVDALCSAEMSAFHIAYTCQPREALDHQVFDAYYVFRIKPVKYAADALGISRKHFYALLSAFRVRVANAAESIADDSQCAHQAMLARRAERSELGRGVRA
jgi:hypothetical protein